MNRIKAIEEKDQTVWRRRGRRRDDESFEGWLSGPPPENYNRPGPGAVIPGDMAKTDMQAIIITQQGEHDNKRMSRGKSDPYAGAYSDKRGENSAAVHPQFSFAFIAEDEEKAKGSVNTEA